MPSHQGPQLSDPLLSLGSMVSARDFSAIFKTVYLRCQGLLIDSVFLLTLENSSSSLMLLEPCSAPSVLGSKLGSCWKAAACMTAAAVCQGPA